jgi:peptidoglycan/xylan/chitin deacetylase (PgdA/CDA1 family)
MKFHKHQKMKNFNRGVFLRIIKRFAWNPWIIGIMFMHFLLFACSPTEDATITDSNASGTGIAGVSEGQNSTAPSQNPTGRNTKFSVETATPRNTESPSNTPNTPQPTSTIITPEPFTMELFNPGNLWEGVEPETYIGDACHYLELRWDPERSPPGTIVAPIMFHSVRKSGRPITDATSISEEYFHNVLRHAKELGFETITSEELVGFLKENAPIPKRSMIMILDDRRPGVTERFIPYLESNDWTLTLGWIIEDQREYLWEWMEELASGGRLDVQSHGYWHRYIVEETPEEIIQEEIYNPIPIIEEHFGTPPIIFIWPGGNFTAKSVEIAHEADFELAFTAYPHGPLMFNWIPQSEEERKVGDPLMTLPRFWSTTAWLDLGETARISQEASQYAIQQYPAEAEWYRRNCGGELPLPAEEGSNSDP